jgi:hypothetical protein
MSLRDLGRIGVTLGLAAVLVSLPALPAWGAGPAGETPAARWAGPAGPWDALWAFLSRLWAKEGPDMDPDGTPQGQSLSWPGADKEGSSMDPDGAPQGESLPGPGPSDQAGSSMDPDGES